ncbi:MAG TPA: carbamoyltransferase C-terminal domain-containing protein [Thermoanaerobaculia bacterium]|nr:carbamoyltransferase C-terminal domain-containing protein [Thermoanaerobaculia bacterium]
MKILGINAVFHDSAACLLVDGVPVAAAEEERFSRIKHHKRTKPFHAYALPFHAIDFCLREAGIKLGDLDHVAYSFDPFPLINQPGRADGLPLPRDAGEARRPPQFDPWQTLFLAGAASAPHLLGDYVPWELQRTFGAGAGGGGWEFHFVPHHVAHAASAFFPSPFDEAAVMTLDGFGGDATTAYGHGRGGELAMLGAVQLPHSLGLLYEQVTGFLGFKPSSDEYKVMALAALGRPAQADTLRRLVQVGEGGRYTVQPLALAERFGRPREPGGPLTQRDLDLACSLQTVLEETVLALAAWLRGATGAADLCLAGGVALNCVLNARLRDDGPFRRLWVQPAAGDAGTALGAALWVDSRRSARERPYRMTSALLGPAYTEEQIAEVLLGSKLRHRRLDDLAGETAELLLQDKVLGWFEGRMEFGPRALGARSILASPLNAATRDRLNDIKGREEFRPVAPAVLAHRAGEWFEPATESPFMLFTHRVRADRIARIPAVQHSDGTARIQTVERDQNRLFFDLIAAFEERTGVPIVVNTSFNTAGRPIVCTPRDAVECFFASPLDALVLGPFLLEK